MSNLKMFTDMKKIFAIALAAFLCLGLVSCQKDLYPDGTDLTSLRVAVPQAPDSVPAAGASFESAVIVNQGPFLDVDWDVTVDGSVDWVSVSKIRYTSHFTGTYAGDDMDVEQNGISCSVSPNTTGKKRIAVLRFTVKDGRSITYTVSQAAK